MLTIFVRHTKKCLGDPPNGIPGLLSKGLSAEKLKVYTHCDCPKWYTGTHDGKWHPRQTLNANSWAEAERKLDAIKGGQQQSKNVSVEHATEKWLAEVKLNGVAPSTLEQWTSVMEKLKAFCQRRKIFQVARLDAEAINCWRVEWTTEQVRNNVTPGIQPNTAKLRLAILSMFCKFVRRMRWVTENPMEMVRVVKAKRGAKKSHPTLPLDLEEGDKNYRALLNSIQATGKGREHLSGITELMYETGLRVSDALCFLVEDMQVDSDGWATYTTIQIKTGTEVTVAIPPELVKTLQGLKKVSEKYLFYNDRSQLRPYYRNHVYGPLKAAAEAVGIVRMHPHRLRDSFAVNRLNEGMLMHDVSKLLGHASVAMTEEYYSPFVKSRQTVLVARRKAAQGTAPTGKVVPIRKRA